MDDNTKLSIVLLVFIAADLLFIAMGYKHGNMHLFKTLEAAAAAWK